MAQYIIPAVASYVVGKVLSGGSRRGGGASSAQLEKQLEFQKEQQAKLDAQKEIYKQFQFENPYTDMENVYEDLTINQQQAQFQAQQTGQQRANILEQLRGAAGGSGIAGLAQTLAGQGALQAQQISASIGQQEMMNQKLRAQGASAADMAMRGGEAMVQEAEMSRQATLLGIQYGGLAGASAGVQSAYSNQMAANTAAMQMQMQNMSTFSNLAQNIPWNEINWGGGFDPNREIKQGGFGYEGATV